MVKALGTNTSLKTLRLLRPELNDRCLQALVDDVKVNKTLEELHFQDDEQVKHPPAKRSLVS
jgi:hypothetical protein